MSNYINDYRTLGIEPGCSLSVLKATRRRLIKSWHPDRFPSASRERRHAEERIKEINTAFDRLIQHHKKFGTLPRSSLHDQRNPPVRNRNTPSPQKSAGAVETPYSASRSDARAGFPESGRHAHARKPLQWASALLAIVFVVGAINILLERERAVTTRASRTPAITHSAPQRHAQPATEQHFAVGSTFAEVYAIQGVPTATESDTWHYGNSKVFFAGGVVTTWHNDPAHPLKVAQPPVKPRLHFFTIGSTKADVRVIQGAPLLETDTMWDYGLSKIYFREDRVIGWESSPMRPLKAQK